jgi:hypothetical protein
MPEPKEDDELGHALAQTDRASTLNLLGAIARRRADGAIQYYRAGIPAKRAWARGLRIAALIAGTLAGLTPLVLPLTVVVFWPSHENLIKDLLPVSAVLAAMSVACIAFDKLFGFSTAWVRFITAELDLSARRDAFATHWAKECLRAGPAPTLEQLVANLDVLAAFLTAINDLVRSETQTWVNEFRGALAELERSVESTRATVAANTTPARGALEVHIADVAQLDDAAWTLQLGGQPPERHSGAASAVLTHVSPGVVRIGVAGTIRGIPVREERAIVVEPGKISTLELDLAARLAKEPARALGQQGAPSS